MSTATQDSAATSLHPLLATLVARLEEAGVPDPLASGAAEVRRWKTVGRTAAGDKLTVTEERLIEEAVISLQGGQHGGKLLNDEQAGKVVGRAEHLAVVMEGLPRNERAEEVARKLLETETSGDELFTMLDQGVKMHRHIARVLKRKAKPMPAPVTASEEKIEAMGQVDGTGEVVVEAVVVPTRPGGRKLPPATPPQPGATGGFEQVHPRGRGGKWVAKGAGQGPEGPDPQVKQLQQRLHELGFQTTQDGQFGTVTEQAVLAFQKKYGLPETGKVDEATVETMRQPPPIDAKTARAQIAAQQGLATKAARQALEKNLSSIGFDSGGADTAVALRRLQRQYGLNVSGKADNATLDLIKRLQERDKRQASKQGGGQLSADQLTHSATTEEPEEGDMENVIEEGAPGWDAAKHPRQRGGKWARVLGHDVQVVKNSPYGEDKSTPHRSFATSHLPDIAGSSTAISAHAAAPLDHRLEYQRHRSEALAASDTPAFEEKARQAMIALRIVKEAHRKGRKLNSTEIATLLKPGESYKHAGVETSKPGKLAEASVSSGGFDTNTPVRQASGGILPLVTPFVPQNIQQPEADDRAPGMDDLWGMEVPRIPPNLHEAAPYTFQRCGTCVHHNGKRLCGLYSAGTGRDDLCDSWLTLSPPEQVNAAMFYAQHVGEFVQEATHTTAALMRSSLAKLEEAVEQTGGEEHAALCKKFTDKGMPVSAAKKAATKALARRRAQEAFAGIAGVSTLDEAVHKLRCRECDTVQSVTNEECVTCSTDLSEARAAKYIGLSESLLDEEEAAGALQEWLLDEATLTATKRKKLGKSEFAIPETESYPIHDKAHARNALARVSQHGTPEEKKRVRAAVKRKHPGVVAEALVLVEVKSSAYPDLERKPGKQNWVDYAGGLPSYIERIAKHIHYEGGKPIGTAIAMAVGTVRRWCAGGGVTKSGPHAAGVSGKTKAQACAAVAEWEAKKKKGGAAQKAAGALKEGAEQEGLDPGVVAVMLAEAEIAALDLPVPEVTPEEALAIMAEVELYEAANVLSMHFDPRLHPRGRTGEFTDVLSRMMKGSRSSEVTLPHGVSVKRSRMGGLQVQSGGKKLGVFKDAGAAAKRALAATGITPDPVSYGKRTERYNIAFDKGTETPDAKTVIGRAFAGERSAMRAKSVTLAPGEGNTATVFSYKEPLAHIDHGGRSVLVNAHKYSPTSAAHRTMVEQEAKRAGYSVRHVDRAESRTRAGMADTPFAKSGGASGDEGPGQWAEKTEIQGGIKLHSRALSNGRRETLHQLPGWKHWRHMSYTRTGNLDTVTDLRPKDAEALLKGDTGGYVHLQGIGRHPATKASEVKVGQHRVYNFGHASPIVGVKSEKGWVHVTVRDKSGQESTRKHRPSSLIPVTDNAEHYTASGGGGTDDQKMIARRVKSGNNEQQSRDLLKELRQAHAPSNLPTALAYHGFVSTGEAKRMSGVKSGGTADLPSYLMGLGTGKHEIMANGVPFTVYYDEQSARGDSGGRVSGDKTGDWEVFHGHGEPLGKSVARVHVSPHGSSGYGNNAAPRYAAEQVANAITAEIRKSGTKSGGAATLERPAETVAPESEGTAKPTLTQRSGLRNGGSMGYEFPKGRSTLQIKNIPQDWLVQHGYAEVVHHPEKTQMYGNANSGRGSKQAAWDELQVKTGLDVERVWLHYLTGRKGYKNAPQGSKMAQQYNYTGKGGKKADREALLRRITEALTALEGGDTEQGDKLLNEALQMRLDTGPVFSPLSEIAAAVVEACPALKGDSDMAALLRAEEAVLVRFPLASVLVKHGAKMPAALRGALQEALREIAPLEAMQARLSEAREQGNASSVKLYEMLVSAVE